MVGGFHTAAFLLAPRPWTKAPTWSALILLLVYCLSLPENHPALFFSLLTSSFLKVWPKYLFIQKPLLLLHLISTSLSKNGWDSRHHNFYSQWWDHFWSLFLWTKLIHKLVIHSSLLWNSRNRIIFGNLHQKIPFLLGFLGLMLVIIAVTTSLVLNLCESQYPVLSTTFAFPCPRVSLAGYSGLGQSYGRRFSKLDFYQCLGLVEQKGSCRSVFIQRTQLWQKKDYHPRNGICGSALGSKGPLVWLVKCAISGCFEERRAGNAGASDFHWLDVGCKFENLPCSPFG